MISPRSFVVRWEVSTLRSLCVGNCAIFHDPCTIHEQAIAICTKYAKIMVYFSVQATTVYYLREGRHDWIQRKFVVYVTIQTKAKYGAALYWMRKGLPYIGGRGNSRGLQVRKALPFNVFRILLVSAIQFVAVCVLNMYRAVKCVPLFKTLYGSRSRRSRKPCKTFDTRPLQFKPFAKTLLLILQKSIWPTKHKDGQSSLHWNWIYLNSQHKYILNSTLLENFHHLNNWAHQSAKRCFSYRTAFSDSNRNDPHCFSFKSGQLGKHHWGWDREVELSAFYQFPNPHQSLFFLRRCYSVD